MLLDDFINKYKGKKVDFDGKYNSPGVCFPIKPARARISIRPLS